MVRRTTKASADFCQLIPAPLGVGSLTASRQTSRGKAVTFTPYTCCIYMSAFRITLGFRLYGPLARAIHASYTVPVRQARVLPSASFPPYLAVQQLLLSYGFPLSRPQEDFHLQVTSWFAFACHLKAPIMTLRAMLGAPLKKVRQAHPLLEQADLELRC